MAVAWIDDVFREVGSVRRVRAARQHQADDQVTVATGDVADDVFAVDGRCGQHRAFGNGGEVECFAVDVQRVVALDQREGFGAELRRELDNH